MIFDMAKGKKKNSRTKEDEGKQKTLASIKVPEQPLTEEKEIDFGGLPERDLKKSLGCG